MASREEGDSGLLRGARTRSYGSLVQSSYSPARLRKLEHLVQPGDTLPGLALKYGVTMEQIKRANRLYTNDSIFLKKYLSIPVLMEQPELINGAHTTGDSGAAGGNGAGKEGTESRPQRSMSLDARKDEVSTSEFMTKLDTRIRVSKRAAVKKMREVAKEEDLAPEEVAGYQGTREEASAQRSLLGPVPLTVTTRTSTLRDREDEMFKL
ncbi:lysM and putative peptidoglycan-binding domain-containing protein 1 [Ranitomeya variabilis]|uniref:lysM and putative peptidoglycan-binding domain-containing protein 1 n=1 Tax=Ranitomeya variabilis TaxID=490064 RepID=UPI0040565111